MRYTDFPACYYPQLEAKDNVVLLETSRYDAANHASFVFVDPIDVLRIDRVEEVSSLLQAIQQATQAGYYAAGYLGYACGAHFEHVGVKQHSGQASPLAWFGIYRTPAVFNHITGQMAGSTSLDVSAEAKETSAAFLVETPTVDDVRFEWTASAYAEQLARIQDYIRAGDAYQINFTGRLRFAVTGSPLALYQMLKRKQPVAYGAYLHADGQHILSLSPELFFHITGNRIVTKPMKGTAPRGRTLAEDDALATWLQGDAKNRAENVMIVDLLRNDLGRICRVGSVQVPDLFTVERYASLLQMTSTVEGILAREVDYLSLFRSLFPSGSVTGAPKMRAMDIIQELEHSPRGVYTGAIGYCAPPAGLAFLEQAGGSPPSGPAAMPQPTPMECAHTAVFNVAIRTVVLQDGHGEMGIGSGIVSDSVAADEYAECLLKARFLTEPAEEFALLETLFWRGRYRRLDLHLQRLKHSATYFGYPFEHTHIRTVLRQQAQAFAPGQRYRVRLTLARTGALACESSRIAEERPPSRATIALWPERTDSHDRFLYHKTTNRARYDAAYRQAVQAGHADVIFLNERDEITEGAISNIFVRQGTDWRTPPISCGLLNGVFRQHVLQTVPHAREAVLHLPDLQAAEEIAICNAIKGWRRVTLQLDRS